MSRETIGSAKPVILESTTYYQRRIKEGSLIQLTEAGYNETIAALAAAAAQPAPEEKTVAAKKSKKTETPAAPEAPVADSGTTSV
jgi:hypothetical protein